jgi:polyvinyl alcohol dehydrogenase (cytochrome)
LLLVGWSVGCGNGDDSSATAPLAALDCSNGDAGDWTMYGQNVCNTRGGTVASDPITAKTVANLKVKWTYDTAGDISATPAVVGGQVYVPDWGGGLTRLDAKTGAMVWTKNVGDILGIGDGGVTVDAGGLDLSGTRAFAAPISRITPVVSGNNLIFGMGSAQSNAILAAVNKDTGALVWQTPMDSHPTALLTGGISIDGTTLYVPVSSGEEVAAGQIPNYPCCTFRGSVVAVDATTGAIKWQTYMIDDATYKNADGSLTGWSGVAVWSGGPTIDRKRKQIYVTTGNNYSTPTPEPATLPAGDHIESILAIDEATGKINWSTRVAAKGGDVWTFSNFSGPDYDLGCGANLFQATVGGNLQDVVGAGQKSGVYWALNPDTGAVLWKTQVGPGGHLGGIHWGTAVDENGVYVPVNDEFGMPYTMGAPAGMKGAQTSVGSWAALNPATGKTLWQIANPAQSAPLNGGSVNGPPAIWNGVLFVGSMDAMGMMYALDAKTGAILWQYQSGASVYSGPAIVNGMVYWGVGYPSSRLGLGSSGMTKFYAFGL